MDQHRVPPILRFAPIIAVLALVGFAGCSDSSSDSPASAPGPTVAAPATTVAESGVGDTIAADAESSSTPIVSSADGGGGPVLVDARGMSVYGTKDDTDGVPSCYADCAATWPPILVADDQLPTGLDPVVFSVVARTDGTFQLRAKDFPLYTFGGDSAPGDANGQGVGGVWYAMSPFGNLIQG